MIKKIVSLYLLGFALFLGIGYYTYSPENTFKVQYGRGFSDSDFGEGFNLWRNDNYASYKGKNDPRGAALSSGALKVPDQKYEKVASIGCVSSTYDSTVDSIKTVISTYEGLVQYEENSGLVGQRSIRLAIGIQPDKFEEALQLLKRIGQLEYFRSDIRDKTNEFRELQARRITLETHLESLKEFKGREGKIDELMNLESKILGVQEQLQKLGVNLGDFDSENEFCTVKLSVKEQVIEEVVERSGAQVLHAFNWAIAKYLTFTWIGLLFAGAFYLVVRIIKQLKSMNITNPFSSKDEKE